MTSGENTAKTQMHPAAADAVGAVHTRWWNALLAADAGTLDTILADDLTFHSPFGTSHTKADFLGGLRTGQLKYDSITNEVPLIRMHAQTAIVTGRVDSHYQWDSQPETERLYYTAVYGWTAPQWQMLAWQSTNRADTES